MAEITPGTGVAGGALVLLWKVFGPTADEVGQTLRGYTAYRLRNVKGILEKAAPLTPELDTDDVAQVDAAQIHPRVAQRLLNEGSWISDDVMQAYLAGLLAASRVPGGLEERGAYYFKVVDALTAPQVKVHYAVYSALAERRRQLNYAAQPQLRVAATVYAPVSDLQQVLPGLEVGFFELGEILVGLMREGLIQTFMMGDEPVLREREPTLSIDSPWFSVQPTPLGVMLYLWSALGMRTSDPNQILAAPEGDHVGGPRLPHAALCSLPPEADVGMAAPYPEGTPPPKFPSPGVSERPMRPETVWPLL